jgi:hypothetical protein
MDFNAPVPSPDEPRAASHGSDPRRLHCGATATIPKLNRRTVGRSSRSRQVQVFTMLAALVVVGMLTLQASRAAFNASTSNGVNNLVAGTVSIADDDAGSVMFNLSAMTPAVAVARCINVIYTGSVTSDVRLYGTVGGSGLATYLNTTIEVGTGAAGGSSFDCTGFSPSATIHNGTLAAFGAANTNYANGLGGFSGATNPTTRSYRVTVTVADNNAAQGLAASTTLTWEAQNV